MARTNGATQTTGLYEVTEGEIQAIEGLVARLQGRPVPALRVVPAPDQTPPLATPLVDVVELAVETLGELDTFRAAHPGLDVLTNGPHLVISQALRNARKQDPLIAARCVAAACGEAAHTIDGLLSRRAELRDLDCDALRNVVCTLIYISRWEINVRAAQQAVVAP